MRLQFSTIPAGGSIRGFLVAGVLLPALVSLQAAAVPEYLKVQQPIPETLTEIPSSTENIGVTPEGWLEQEAALPPRLRTLLPQWRERYAPHTGQPFLDEMVFLVKPRLYYFQRDIEGDRTSEALAIGGAFSVESGWLNDLLRVNLTGYTSQKLHGPEDRDGTGLLALGQKGYSVLGEAFVELKARRSSIFAGRVPSQLPFINGSDSRMTPNTFEGIGFRSVEIRNLQLGGGHFTKIKPRTSTSFIPMSEWAGVEGTERGVSAIGLRYNFTEDFYIGCINQYGWDMFNTLYLESDRLFTIADDLSLQIGAQFTDQRSVGQELQGSFSTQSTGLRASLGYHSLIASASATWNAENAGIRHPWGGTPAFNSSMISDFDRAGEKSIRLGASYDFSQVGLTGLAASTAWIFGTTPDSGSAASPDQQEVDINLDYRPDIPAMRDFWFRIRYARNNRDEALVGRDRQDIRVILNYSHAF